MKGSAEPKPALAECVERPPEQAIEKRDQYAHHRDAEHDPGKVAGLGGLRDIGGVNRHSRIAFSAIVER
jgi:hypothetical protein